MIPESIKTLLGDELTALKGKGKDGNPKTKAANLRRLEISADWGIPVGEIPVCSSPAYPAQHHPQHHLCIISARFLLHFPIISCKITLSEDKAIQIKRKGDKV